MRIAHADCGEACWRAGNRRIEPNPRRVRNSMRKRNLAPAAARRAHIDREDKFAVARHRQRPRVAFEQQFLCRAVTHQQISNATRAIAACIGGRAIAVIDPEPRRGAGTRRVMQDHELVEAEPRHAVDGPRLPRAHDMRGAPEVQHGNCIADAVHLHDRPIGEGSHIRVPVPRTYRRKQPAPLCPSRAKCAA